MKQLEGSPVNLIMLEWIPSGSALPLDDFEDFIAVHNSGSGIGRFKAAVFLVQME